MRDRVDVDDIKMVGHWSGEHVFQSYLTGIVLPACCAAAGMANPKSQTYVCKRNRIDREQYRDLHAAVFPGLHVKLEEVREVSGALGV